MKIQGRPAIDLDIIIRLNEQEARFLDALVGYGWEGFIKVFREKLGKAYIEPYEKAGKELFETIRNELPSILHDIDKARSTFQHETE